VRYRFSHKKNEWRKPFKIIYMKRLQDLMYTGNAWRKAYLAVGQAYDADGVSRRTSPILYIYFVL
jgi:hypothetical protein